MAKDILIYGRIDEYSLRQFFADISEAQEQDVNAELVYRINTPGGEPEYGFGAAAKVKETVTKKVKVDGMAYSWGLFACVYADDVECLDVSKFLVHRAAYSDWFEKSEYFTEPLKENLLSINADLEKAFRNRIDVEAFENLKQVKSKGITIKDIFSMDSRIDVFFSAADAKKIKLVNKVVRITPQKQTELEALNARAMSCHEVRMAAENPSPIVTKSEQSKNKIMTLEEIRSQHPALYAQIKAEGHVEGVAAEKDRVDSILVFNEIDPAGCKLAIESGKALTAKQTSEFALKSFSKEALAKLTKDSAVDVTTTEVPDPAKKKTEKEKEIEAFEAEVQNLLKK